VLRGPATVPAVAQVFVADLDSLALSREDAHHLSKSLRVRTGETVLAADGRGHWRPCRYTGATGNADEAELLEADGPAQFEAAPAVAVTVGFVPVKGERPEWVVQKLTELGVDRIVVLRSARGVVRWEGDRARAALDRLRRVASQASAQSRRAWLPRVDGVLSLPELAEDLAPEPLALADPGGKPPNGQVTAIAIGPEGGWDHGEGEFPGAIRLGLGPTVQRAETAAVSSATLLCALRDGTLRPR